MGSKDEEEISNDILAYLAENPAAQDTLEGIVQWWIVEREIIRQASAVKRVIAKLVSEGFLLEKQGPDSRVHYGLNGDRLDEIEAMMNRVSK